MSVRLRDSRRVYRKMWLRWPKVEQTEYDISARPSFAHAYALSTNKYQEIFSSLLKMTHYNIILHVL